MENDDGVWQNFNLFDLPPLPTQLPPEYTGDTGNSGDGRVTEREHRVLAAIQVAQDDDDQWKLSKKRKADDDPVVDVERYGKPPEEYGKRVLAPATLRRNTSILAQFFRCIDELRHDPNYPYGKYLEVLEGKTTASDLCDLYLQSPAQLCDVLCLWVGQLRKLRKAGSCTAENPNGERVKPGTLRNYIERLQCEISRELGLRARHRPDLAGRRVVFLGEKAEAAFATLANAVDGYCVCFTDGADRPYEKRQADEITIDDLTHAYNEGRFDVRTPHGLQNRVVVVLGMYFGLRRSEMSQLMWRDLVWGTGYVDGRMVPKVTLPPLKNKNNQGRLKDHNKKHDDRSVYFQPGVDARLEPYTALKEYFDHPIRSSCESDGWLW